MQAIKDRLDCKVAVLLCAVLLALGLALPGAAYADDDTTWAYAGITLDSEALGIGTVYYTSTYFEGEDLVNPTTLVAYTDDEVAAIIAAADTTADAYVEAPADAVLGVSVYGTDTIYWYDAEAAAAIVTYSDALVLDADTGELTISTTSTTTVATALEVLEDNAIAAYRLREVTGVGAIYYTEDFFLDDTLWACLQTANSDLYTDDYRAAISERTSDVDAPDGAYLGIETEDGTFWYDYDATVAIVKYSEALSVSSDGTVTTSDGTTVATAADLEVNDVSYTWAYTAITVDGVGTVYYGCGLFYDSTLQEYVVASGLYDSEMLLEIAEFYESENPVYIVSPDGAYLGIAVEGADTIYWYDYDAALAILSYADALDVDADTGTVTYTSTTTTTVATPLEEESADEESSDDSTATDDEATDESDDTSTTDSTDDESDDTSTTDSTDDESDDESDDSSTTEDSGTTGTTGGSGSGAAPGGGSSSGSQGGSQGGSQSGSSQGAFAQTGDAASTAVLAVLACGIAALVVALVARRRQSVR